MSPIAQLAGCRRISRKRCFAGKGVRSTYCRPAPRYIAHWPWETLLRSFPFAHRFLLHTRTPKEECHVTPSHDTWRTGDPCEMHTWCNRSPAQGSEVQKREHLRDCVLASPHFTLGPHRVTQNWCNVRAKISDYVEWCFPKWWGLFSANPATSPLPQWLQTMCIKNKKQLPFQFCALLFLLKEGGLSLQVQELTRWLCLPRSGSHVWTRSHDLLIYWVGVVQTAFCPWRLICLYGLCVRSFVIWFVFVCVCSSICSFSLNSSCHVYFCLFCTVVLSFVFVSVWLCCLCMFFAMYCFFLRDFICDIMYFCSDFAVPYLC